MGGAHNRATMRCFPQGSCRSMDPQKKGKLKGKVMTNVIMPWIFPEISKKESKILMS